MKTLSSKKWNGLYALALANLLLMVVISCDNDPGIAPQTSEDSNEALYESEETFLAEDADDIAMELVDATGETTNGKLAAEIDDRLSCAVITREGDEESGTITISFAEGCEDPRGNSRKGSIIVTYSGKIQMPGSYYSLTYSNYSINGIQLEGTRLVKNISDSDTGVQEFSVDMEDGVLTWPDGSIARRTIHHRRRIERDPSNILDRLIIYGTAEGNHRNGRGFYIEILERLVYDRTCKARRILIPVEGVKLIKHGERQITVDYGDGACDNMVTITNKAGRSWRYAVGD